MSPVADVAHVSVYPGGRLPMEVHTRHLRGGENLHVEVRVDTDGRAVIYVEDGIEVRGWADRPGATS